jgi:flagellar biosynthetic protein FliS
MMSQFHKETTMTSITPATPAGSELPVPASAIVAMLFDDLVASIDEAMRCIDAGQIEARFRALTQATDIVGDLAAGLDEDATDDWSKRTEALYKYLIRLFMMANIRNTKAPLEEGKLILEPVRRAWQCMAAEEKMRAELARRGVRNDAADVTRWFQQVAAE